MRSIAVLLAFAAALAQETRPTWAGPIRVGPALSGVLEGVPAARAYDFDAEADGLVTISLESFDFDAVLRVETEAGEILAEDDDGGVETNARLVLHAKAGEPYRVVAAAKEGAGEFTISISAGDLPPPAGAALLDSAIAFRAKAAERALARADKKAAADHRLAEGNRQASRSHFADAKTAYESSITLARDSGDRAGEATAIGNLGAVYFQLGEYPKAREHYEKHLALARELRDRAGEARALGNLGVLYRSLGDYPNAREHCEKHLALARELGDRRGEANALGNLGIVDVSLGNYTKAQERFEKQLALARELRDPPEEATALGSLGTVYRRLGDYPRARELYEQRLALARRLGDRSKESRALGDLGNVHDFLGDYPKAQECHERYLALSRELGDRVREVRALGNLGNVHRALGGYAKARERYEASLLLARELGFREGEASALGSLGNLHSLLGDYPQARELYEMHLALARESGDRAGEATTVGNLGVLHRSLGDYVRALEHFERHLALVREMGDRAGEATTVGNLGDVLYSLGDWPGARKHHERHHDLSRELGDRAGEAKALEKLGKVYESLGDYTKAREHHEAHLALARELGNRAGEARGLANLGDVFYSLGDRAKARECAGESLDAYGRLGREEDCLQPLATLARSALAEANAPAAREALAKALPLLDRPSTRSLEIAERAGLRSRFARWSEIAQDLAAAEIQAASADAPARMRAQAEGFLSASGWKGRALLEGIGEHRRGARSAEALGLRRQWRESTAHRNGILERVSRSIQEGKASEEIQGLREEARSLLERLKGLAARLREVSPRDAALDLPLGARPEAVRKALGHGTALVEYAHGERRLYAYVLAHERLASLDLGEREAIREKVDAFLSLVGDPAALGSLEAVAEKGREAFERLLAPVLAEAGEGIEGLVVVPTGALAALPFEALVIGTKAGEVPRSFADVEFVLDRYEVCYAPSSPVLVEIASMRPRRGETKALVLADPLYPSEPYAGPQPSSPESLASVTRGAARSVPAPSAFSRLPRTRDEALALARLLLDPADRGVRPALEGSASTRSLSLSGRRFALHLGERASLNRLPVGLREYSILHLAAHGFVDSDHPQRTGIALSFREGQDGYLAIADVLELDLDAELVVLSACETARGEAKAGEGVESLARAFLYAGARAVVASLWKVADAAAARTMEGFYREALVGKRQWSEALREAKLEVRRARIPAERERGVAGVSGGEGVPGSGLDSGHPFFWAPFVHIGLPR